MEDDDEFNENRYTNCFKKYFAADTYPTCLEFSPSDNTLMVGTSFQKILPLNSENINAPLNDKQSILQIKEVADKEDKNALSKENLKKCFKEINIVLKDILQQQIIWVELVYLDLKG